MKKFIILWFMLLLIVKCSFEKEQEKVTLVKDPLINAYSLDREVLTKDKIKSDLSYFLMKYKRNWSKKNIDKTTEVLYKGQEYFSIDYQIVLSIIAIESQFKIDAKGRNKKSIDFGLCQQNSFYIKQRYKASERVLKECNIKYTDSKFDIAKNIFSCFMYLKSISEYSDLIQFSDYITAYNQGVRGAKRNKDNRYYDKFIKEYLSI